jgi:hypothetical protein
VGSCPLASQLAMGDRRSLSQPDAEGHLQLFRQRVPNIRFEVVFDLPKAEDNFFEGLFLII